MCANYNHKTCTTIHKSQNLNLGFCFEFANAFLVCLEFSECCLFSICHPGATRILKECASNKIIKKTRTHREWLKNQIHLNNGLAKRWERVFWNWKCIISMCVTMHIGKWVHQFRWCIINDRISLKRWEVNGKGHLAKEKLLQRFERHNMVSSGDGLSKSHSVH